MRYLLSAAIAVACAASATSAMAVESAEIGLLECRGASQQFIVGSVTNLRCLYRPSDGGRPQAYDAQIRRVGLDIGYNQSTVLFWSVFAPNRPGPGRSAAPMSAPPPTRQSASASAPMSCGAAPTAPSPCSRERTGPDWPRRRRWRVGNGDAPAPIAARSSRAPRPSSSALSDFSRSRVRAAAPQARRRFHLARLARAAERASFAATSAWGGIACIGRDRCRRGCRRDPLGRTSRAGAGSPQARARRPRRRRSLRAGAGPERRHLQEARHRARHFLHAGRGGETIQIVISGPPTSAVRSAFSAPSAHSPRALQSASSARTSPAANNCSGMCAPIHRSSR